VGHKRELKKGGKDKRSGVALAARNYHDPTSSQWMVWEHGDALPFTYRETELDCMGRWCAGVVTGASSA